MRNSSSRNPLVSSILSLLAVLVVLVVLAVLSLLGLLPPAEAQTPRGSIFGRRWEQPYNTQLLRQYLIEGGFYHTVTVDSGGSGDFTDLSVALNFIAAQNPSFANQWTVRIHPGIGYQEQSLTIPPFTLVQGATSPGPRSLQPLGRPILRITGTTGSGVILGLGSGLADLGLTYTGALTAGYKAVDIPLGAIATLTRLEIIIGTGAANVPLEILSVTGGDLTLEDTSIQRGGNGMTATRHLVCSSGSAVLAGAWFLASSNQAAVVETTGGVVRVLHSRIYGGAAIDLKNTSGTLSVDHVSYTTESGPITRAGALSPRITNGGTTVPSTCTTPELYIDTVSTTPRLCACTAANTWRCAPLS